MMVHRVSYHGVGGNLYCEFFGAWLRTVFDYPHDLNGKELAPWRPGQAVFGSIHASKDVRALA